MSYDNRAAKIKICYALKEKGWKIYGYRADESDSMTDYYSPAYWNGVAEKNGFVLLVDVYGTGDSGREVKEYSSNRYQQNAVSNQRITKLTAMMEDSASTDNEKKSCATLIEKEQEKLNVEHNYTVKETYPIFKHANPKACSWHIEKDGQILAKGKGVFSTNDYDWTNKEVSAEDQKKAKLDKFINKIEKVLTDSEALTPHVIKVPKTVIRAVEKDITELTQSDITLGLQFIYKVTYTHGNYKGTRYELIRVDEQFNKYNTFARLGKNNKPSKSIDKHSSLSLEQINDRLKKGHIAIIELKEFTEYEEKTVYKKTTRKVKLDKKELAASTTDKKEKEQVKEDNNSTITASYKINEEKNGIEIKFTSKPSVNIIESLKEFGFKWSKYSSIWWAKKTEERLKFVDMLIDTYNSIMQEEPETVEEEVQEYNNNPTEEKQEEDKYNFNVDTSYKYHDIHFKAWTLDVTTITELMDITSINYYISGNKFICTGLTLEHITMIEMINEENEAIIFYDNKYNELADGNSSEEKEPEKDNIVDFQTAKDHKNNIKEGEEMGTVTEDIFSKFDNIKVENNNRISKEDQEFCEDQEEKYHSTIEVLKDAHNALSRVYNNYEGSNNGYAVESEDLNNITERMQGNKENFIIKICSYFKDKYSVTIETNFKTKYENEVTYNQILDEIIIQMDGYSFKEKSNKEIKDAFKEKVKRYGGEIGARIKGNKVTIESLHITRYCDIYKQYELSWQGRESANKFFKALSNFEFDTTEAHWKFTNYYLGRDRGDEAIFQKYEIDLDKIKTMKMFKNGKVEVQFSSSEQAKKFIREYCGVSNVA